MNGTFYIGGSAPKPPGFSAFFPPEWPRSKEGRRCRPCEAVPAAETVARVASQHCPIPSGSGTISLKQHSSAGYEKPANGNLSLFTLSHRRGSLHHLLPFTPIHPDPIHPTRSLPVTVLTFLHYGQEFPVSALPQRTRRPSTTVGATCLPRIPLLPVHSQVLRLNAGPSPRTRRESRFRLP